jgi:deoxyribodipyrimidine photo-lyase
MPSYADARLRQVNDRPIDASGRFILYWIQAYRRLNHNHSLDHALQWAIGLKKPLVVYEGLRLNYPWASARLHQFILEGMADNVARAKRLGINYWPFVETSDQPGRGLLHDLAKRACLVITDDFPAFIIPRQTASLAKRSPVRVIAVDGNSMVPLSLLGGPVVAAAHMRPRIHEAFAEAWRHRAAKEPEFPKVIRVKIAAPFAVWQPGNIQKFIATLPIDQSVIRITNVGGGYTHAKRVLQSFEKKRLPGYAVHRSEPAEPDQGHGSGLSPYLHFGHLSIEEVVTKVLGRWSLKRLNPKCRGKREGYYQDDADVNAFLDEAITWRDVGYHWHYHRGADVATLETALPAWALATLLKHAKDRREHLYTSGQLEAADTHDELWNAAQTELVRNGTIHNYLRMLWGKKVLEWTESPTEAYRILVHLNNKYALDGRDPNSYTGILWCFGLFDRPWPPERPVFGSVRYMSSANTARKFDLEGYYTYVQKLKN